MFLTIDEHKFFIVQHGAGDRVFLAHSGFVGTNEDWLPTLEILSRSWRTVAHDHRGAGETLVPVEEISAQALVDDIFRILDALRIERCVLAGFSSGVVPVLGAIVQASARFEGLVLANGAGRLRPPGTTRPPLTKPSQWPGETHSERMRWFIEKCTPEKDFEHIRRWGHHMLMRAEESAAEKLMEVSYHGRPDLADRLKEINVPTLLIHGEHDFAVSLSEMQYVSSLIPHSKLVVLPETGHLPAMTQPENVAALINEHFGVALGLRETSGERQ